MALQGNVNISSSSTLTLTTAYSIYVYNGSLTAVWTLPPVSGNSGEILWLCNRGSAAVTVNCAGSDHLYAGGTPTSISLLAGAPLQLMNDGTYWLVTSGTLPPAYDHSAISAYKSGVGSGTAFTWTQTATAGSYGIIAVVGLCGGADLGATPVVSLGGVSLTSKGNIYNANSNALGYGWTWVFAAPGIPGGVQTASVKLTQAGKTFTGWAASFTYTGVNVAGALQTSYGTTALGDPSQGLLSLNSAPNGIVWGLVGSSGGYTALGQPFTLAERQQYLNGGNFPFFIAGDGPTAAGVAALLPNNITWSITGLSLT